MFIGKLVINEYKYGEKSLLIAWTLSVTAPLIMTIVFLSLGIYTYTIPLDLFLLGLGVYIVMMTEIIFLKNKSTPNENTSNLKHTINLKIEGILESLGLFLIFWPYIGIFVYRREIYHMSKTISKDILQLIVNLATPYIKEILIFLCVIAFITLWFSLNSLRYKKR